MELSLKEALCRQHRDRQWVFAGRLDAEGAIDTWLCIRPDGGERIMHTFPVDGSRAPAEKQIIEMGAPSAESIYAVLAGEKWPEPFTGRLGEIATVNPEEGKEILTALANGKGIIDRDGDEPLELDYLGLREACRGLEEHGGWLAMEELNDDGVPFATSYISSNPLRLSTFRFDGVEGDILNLESIKCSRDGRFRASFKKDGRNMTRIARVGTWRALSPPEVVEEFETICRVL